MASKKPKKKIVKKVVVKKKTAKPLPAKKAVSVKSDKSPSDHKPKAKNIPRQRTVAAYKFKEDKAIMPTEETILPSLRGVAPAVFKDLPEHLQPTKVVDHRIYLTDDPSDDSELPPLISVQLQSYRWLLGEGVSELLQEISPITDFSGRKMEVHFLGHTYDPPKYD